MKPAKDGVVTWKYFLGGIMDKIMDVVFEAQGRSLGRSFGVSRVLGGDSDYSKANARIPDF